MVTTELSIAEKLASLPKKDRDAIIAGMNPAYAGVLPHDWRVWARPKQIAPEGDWRTWVIRAGRGFGKTRAGGGWVHERAEQKAGRWIALVAKTPADARDYMIEGPGGIIRNAPPWCAGKVEYEPSKRRLTWPNGSWATVYSSEEPDQLRGFSGDTAWLDELAKWRRAKECWDMLQYGMREASSDHPRALITTTPRPIPVLRQILQSPNTVEVTGSSYENKSNLDPGWYTDVLSQYEGTRLGRQEIHGEILDDTPGALWTLDMIDAHRVSAAPDLVRIVVAIDPAVTAGEESDSTGIIVGGIDRKRHGYVLADLTCRVSPERWASVAVGALDRYDGDRIIAEANNGGDLVESVLRAVDRNIPYKKVHAARGKRTRAEPVAALYEQGKIHHVGSFPELEDEMTTFVPGDDSPDRMDALVWAFTELLVRKGPGVAFSGMPS